VDFNPFPPLERMAKSRFYKGFMLDVLNKFNLKSSIFQSNLAVKGRLPGTSHPFK
jgi:hypothetical protein